MKILVINGSPRREKSSTSRVTKKFLEGISSVKKCDVEWINVDDLNITPCRGCLSCWGRTEGECVIKGDDVQAVKEKIILADTVVLSFPLYIFGLPGTLKVLMDRLVSLLRTYEGQVPVEGKAFHGFRRGNSGLDANHKQTLFVISTCGYMQADLVYDPLLSQLDTAWGKENYYALLCPQGQSFQNEQLFERIEKFLEKYIEAGAEFARTEKLSPQTIAHLREGPFNARHYKLLMDLYWKTERAGGRLPAGEKDNV